MWRALIVACGIMAIIFGIECLVIDSAVLYSGRDTSAVNFLDPTGAPSDKVSVWKPREWMPWAVLSFGTITILYAFTIPRRFRSFSVEG